MENKDKFYRFNLRYAGQETYVLTAKRITRQAFINEVIAWSDFFQDSWKKPRKESLKELQKVTTCRGCKTVLFENRSESCASEKTLADTTVVEYDVWVIGDDFSHAYAVAERFFERNSWGPYTCKF
jgi:hypothetical protein